MRAPETLWGKVCAQFRDEEMLSRIGLGLCAIFLLVVGLLSWQAPFPYREGDYVPHGISAKIEFERVDEEETQRARERAQRAVPFIFRNEPDPLKLLPERLRASLGEIAQASRLADLREETKTEFGLAPAPPDELRGKRADELFGTSDPQARFAALKDSIVDMQMAQERIDAMVDAFSKFIDPLIKHGLIDPDDVRRQRITADRYLLVVDEGEDVEATRDDKDNLLLLPQVRLEDQLNDAGELGKSWLSYPSLPQSIHAALSHWLMVRAEPTLRYDQVATKNAIAEAIAAVPDRMERYLVGDQLVAPREAITDEKLELLRDEYRAAEAQISLASRLVRVGIVFFLCLVLAIINGYYIVRNEPRLVHDFARYITYLAALVLTAIAARLLSFDPMRAEVVPLLATLLLLCIAYNQFLATLTAFSLCLILSLSTTGRLDQLVVLLSACAAAIMPLTQVASRSTLIKVSFLAGLSYFVVSMGVSVIETQSLSEVFRNEELLGVSLKGAALCLLAGFLVAGALPFVESTFGVVTDMSLLELSDPSHPLLQDLVRLAPGTYNHSIAVASIGESAAERIGANGLLVRVGAYFHDIGKMLKPHYFIENVQAGSESRHKQLNPTMSTLIIIGHVKDGVDLAEQHRLPRPIIDFIEQHHGTTLVEYFFHEASRQAEADPLRHSEAEESAFRYPGPKPATKEAGVLMIADCCESACRTLTEPTPKRIESLVHTLVMRRLLDGQFDECDLKMSEIHEIEQSVVKSLIGIYHGRIRYPDANSA